MKNREKMLLHCCCGPCSSNVTGDLLKEYDVTLFYYNPSMDSKEEFDKRLASLKIVSEFYNVPLIVIDYNNDEFLKAVVNHERDKEGGNRCEICFYQRLSKTCEFACENQFDIFTTTLTVSPMKNSDLINKIGEILAKKYNLKFLVANFKKNNGYLKSIEMSKKLGLYRQNYCGCVFSKKNIFFDKKK